MHDMQTHTRRDTLRKRHHGYLPHPPHPLPSQGRSTPTPLQHNPKLYRCPNLTMTYGTSTSSSELSSAMISKIRFF